MMKRTVAGTVFALSIAVAAAVFAGEPVHRTIPYRKNVSLPAPKTYRFQFSIHNAASAGQLLWLEEKQLRLTGRTLSHSLGSVNLFDNGASGPLDFSEQYWVQVASWTARGDGGRSAAATS